MDIENSLVIAKYDVHQNEYSVIFVPNTEISARFLTPETTYQQSTLNGYYIKELFTSLFSNCQLNIQGQIGVAQIQGNCQGMMFHVYITMFIDTDGPQTQYTVQMYFKERNAWAYFLDHIGYGHLIPDMRGGKKFYMH